MIDELRVCRVEWGESLVLAVAASAGVAAEPTAAATSPAVASATFACGFISAVAATVVSAVAAVAASVAASIAANLAAAAATFTSGFPCSAPGGGLAKTMSGTGPAGASVPAVVVPLSTVSAAAGPGCALLHPCCWRSMCASGCLPQSLLPCWMPEQFSQSDSTPFWRRCGRWGGQGRWPSRRTSSAPSSRVSCCRRTPVVCRQAPLPAPNFSAGRIFACSSPARCPKEKS
jgi:hypothetical protein